MANEYYCMYCKQVWQDGSRDHICPDGFQPPLIGVKSQKVSLKGVSFFTWVAIAALVAACIFLGVVVGFGK